MKRVAAVIAVCSALLLAPGSAFAQTDASAPKINAEQTFSDPAMSFTAPSDFKPVPVLAHDPAQFEQPTVVAGFVKNPGKSDSLAITIQMDNFEGNLQGWEMNTENTLRTSADGVFIKKAYLPLSNGMPAFWQEVTIGSGFNEMKRFEYVWADGVRGVTLALTGRYGAISESDAKKALSDVHAVAYPKYRY